MQKRQALIVDASYDQDTGRTGIGIAVHEADKPRRNGILIDVIAECYTGIPSGYGEMLAVYRALELGAERGFKDVKIRSDYNCMRKALKKSHEQAEGADREDLYGSIMRLARRYDSVHFGYKPRRKNQMAHCLARRAIREKAPIHRVDLTNICLKIEPKVKHNAGRRIEDIDKESFRDVIESPGNNESEPTGGPESEVRIITGWPI